MKIFFFLAVLVGCTAAQNITINIDLGNIIREIDENIDNFVDNFAADLQSAANEAARLLVDAWNLFRRVSIRLISLFSSSYANLLQSAIDATSGAFLYDFNGSWLRNVSRQYFQNAREIYGDALQYYIANLNASYDAYQCWNASRADVAQVLNSFINETIVESRPLVSEFRNYTNGEFKILSANFTSYRQGAFNKCASLLLWTIRSCLDNYVSSKVVF